MSTRNTQGFTLVELMIVAVLGAVVVASTYQILLTSQQAYTMQSAQIKGQQTVRIALDILRSELREISPSGGDILEMSSSSITVRTPVAFGMVCAVESGGSPITVKKMGKFFTNGDSVTVMVDRDPRIASDDTIYFGTITAIDTTVTCTGTDEAQELTVPAIVTAMTAGDTVRSGGPVRAFEIHRYGYGTYRGAYYLLRFPTSGGYQALVGPLSSNGITFGYLDSLGNTTTDRTAVAQIEVTVRSHSDVVDRSGSPIGDSLTTRIYLRN